MGPSPHAPLHSGERGALNISPTSQTATPANRHDHRHLQYTLPTSPVHACSATRSPHHLNTSQHCLPPPPCPASHTAPCPLLHVNAHLKIIRPFLQMRIHPQQIPFRARRNQILGPNAILGGLCNKCVQDTPSNENEMWRPGVGAGRGGGIERGLSQHRGAAWGLSRTLGV